MLMSLCHVPIVFSSIKDEPLQELPPVMIGLIISSISLDENGSATALYFILIAFSLAISLGLMREFRVL